MLKYEGNIDIIIDLPNGIYCFRPESGCGKSRLSSILKNYYFIDRPVISFTYKDLLLGIPISDLIKPGEQKILMLDRYDLYNGMLKKQIIEFAKTGVVLLDVKGLPKVPCVYCFMEMDEGIINVFQDE